MSAIHALNPDAFIDGDIDRLRRGHTLTRMVPSLRTCFPAKRLSPPAVLFPG
jgi:Tfp pilus assembly protein FimV